MLVSQDHRAHPYVDIAHRAALLYSFATLLVAVFVQFSAWPAWVNLTAAMVLVFFFVAAILSYIAHGLRRDTDNQFANPDRALKVGMIALIVGEVGGFGVLLAGFIAGHVLAVGAHWRDGPGSRSATDRLLQRPGAGRLPAGDGLPQRRRHRRGPRRRAARAARPGQQLAVAAGHRAEDRKGDRPGLVRPRTRRVGRITFGRRGSRRRRDPGGATRRSASAFELVGRLGATSRR